ncbi:transporter [Guyparkeria hydrothermalis]|uniref:transporter n=1 Tax=Guyparkeria hydrothermalis TaxID=923 RepID=UPI002020DBF4|nr:transporter [Guyparkeria hydrothermalis]MCL7743876.1 transporter [Guyparkeria hydrothermalis]
MDDRVREVSGRGAAVPVGLSILALGLTMGLSPAALAANEADNVQQMREELESLKQRYVNEVRRLRELDARLMAVQTRLSEAGVEPEGDLQPDMPIGAAAAAEGDTATAPTEEDKRQATRRSVDDFLQQEHVAFDRPLVVEAGFEYSRYDRTQLTLNGFLALDAIFLGNIAVDNVASDTFKYTLAARYGLTPRWNVGVSAPFIQRYTTYQKGGAGGSAAAFAEVDQSSDIALGDTTFNLSYRLLPETVNRPDVVLTGSVIAPTGQEPYGIDWRVIETGEDAEGNAFVRFAIPEEQATGNGLWGVGASVSAVKTLDPALLFANLGYTHYLSRSFDDLNNDPDTVNPGDVELGDSWTVGLGLAFALNDKASLSMSYSQQINGQARTRYDGEDWVDLIGSDANSATLNLGLTYALGPKTTLVTSLGVGLTPDAPDFTLGVRIPYAL